MAKRVAEYRTGGLQNIGQEGSRILDKWVAKYWTGGLRTLDRSVQNVATVDGQ